ncbi:protein OBERON 3 isoform X2 [Syzygium oleosum]|uniref:protein OBERON 3 isoform X2 n=1 Tax=Syzygium oleosum TaxID=219896 RepID=UPI0024B936F9|nr:protein OBERON 3 isoform X2 [Syzygium oleosum]
MFGEKDLSNGGHSSGYTAAQQIAFGQSKENPDTKMGSREEGMDLFKSSKVGLDGFQSRNSRTGNSGSQQELTFSYMCDNSKLGFLGKDVPREISPEKASYKGKEIASGSENPSKDGGDGDNCVERDFMNLSGGGSSRWNFSKREAEEEIERENRDKKTKLETLNLSLALPDVSLSLTASNALQNADPPPAQPKPTRSTNTNTTYYSNDFTAPSMSYSYSHPFSHNPSCSLTRNSTENYDCSVGRDDQIWYGGEGTNGSVHSRFKPLGDGSVALSNPGGGGNFVMQGASNSFYRPTNSDNHSFFPSELPARPRKDTVSGDLRGRNSDHLRDLECMIGDRARKLSRPEKIIREIVLDSIPIMAQTVQELSEEVLESTKEYLRTLVAAPERVEELAGLQKRLDKRSDLTKETLSKCNKDQLEILVAVRTGLGSFLSGKNRLPAGELVDIFLFLRCKNVNCKSFLPVEDCECKICSSNKGFCSSCMCPICLKFDCASNTCSWVGCDVCSHWCHADCGIRRNLIRPGPSLKGPSGTTEMQFHCIGCDHASEMYGFVKDVFSFCAKDWGLETLMKELDCVRKIFRNSEDRKGKKLHEKAEELLLALESKAVLPSDACNILKESFTYIDGISDFSAPSAFAKLQRESARRDPAFRLQSTYMRPLAPSETPSNSLKELKPSLTSELTAEDELRSLLRKDSFDSLESVIRIKEAEAQMFQSKADDARSEAEGYKQMIQMRMEKLEEEYAQKLAKLCLQETEERRKKKLEELKFLENSHCDYQKMKMRMQAEIAGLLERMEATKKQLVHRKVALQI